MSNTIKGSKPCGYEYWSKRPASGHLPVGRIGKKMTSKRERAQQRENIFNELDERDTYDGISLHGCAVCGCESVATDGWDSWEEAKREQIAEANEY